MEENSLNPNQQSQKRKKTNAVIGGQLGRYRLMSKLGQGGVGTVYKACDTKLDRIVALKTLSLGNINDKTVQRFAREAKCNAKLCHPNIVVLYDFEEISGTYCITMEFIEGSALEQTLSRQKLPIARSCQIMFDILGAINYAHQQGIIHRDLKPSNILINKDGKPFLTDFGLAKALGEAAKISQTGALLGTPAYMSPEQASANSNNPVDTRSDIYSLGAVFYEMLTGKRVIEGDSVYNVLFKIVGEEVKPPREINPGIPIELDRICMRALAKKKEERYQTAVHMATDIRQYLKKLDEEDFLTSAKPWRLRAKRIAISLVALCLLLLGISYLVRAWENHSLSNLVSFFRPVPSPTERWQQAVVQLESKYAPYFTEDQKDGLRMAQESLKRRDYLKSRNHLRGLMQITGKKHPAYATLQDLFECVYFVELDDLCRQRAWSKAYLFTEELKGSQSSDLVVELERYIEQEYEGAFQKYYQDAKAAYKNSAWKECAEAVLKGLEYHPDHPILRDWGKQAGSQLAGEMPERWRKDKWLACWNDKEEWLDFTNKAWAELSPEDQVWWAKAYQAWYAKKIVWPWSKSFRIAPPGSLRY